VPLPLLVSVATASSSPCAFTALVWKPLPSPPLSGELAAGLRKPGAPPPPPPAAVTVSPAVRLVLPNVAVRVTGVVLVTGAVVAVNVRLDDPAGTVTLAGTVAADGLLLDRPTTVPPDGAGPVNVTVPVDDVPPLTVAGLNDSAESVAPPPPEPGVTVSAAAQDVFSSAHTLLTVVDDTLDVVTLKVAEVAPAGTVTLSGADAGPCDDS
jgi:hypothetical protein